MCNFHNLFEAIFLFTDLFSLFPALFSASLREAPGAFLCKLQENGRLQSCYNCYTPVFICFRQLFLFILCSHITDKPCRVWFSCEARFLRQMRKNFSDFRGAFCKFFRGHGFYNCFMQSFRSIYYSPMRRMVIKKERRCLSAASSIYSIGTRPLFHFRGVVFRVFSFSFQK